MTDRIACVGCGETLSTSPVAACRHCGGQFRRTVSGHAAETEELGAHAWGETPDVYEPLPTRRLLWRLIATVIVLVWGFLLATGRLL